MSTDANSDANSDANISSPVKNAITVVTGLPRSGTSMMMQMIVAGGLPALTDDRRQADEDNPKGYFEFEQVKNLRQDNSWILQSKGRVVKIIAQLLEHLPPENYRTIFMQRDLNEVLHSQETMLQRADKRGAQLPREQLKAIFSKQLLQVEKLMERISMPMLKVSYHACIEDPVAVAAVVNQFLGGKLNESEMVAAVDAKLYRQRERS
jgi:hypothetical protein